MHVKLLLLACFVALQAEISFGYYGYNPAYNKYVRYWVDQWWKAKIAYMKKYKITPPPPPPAPTCPAYPPPQPPRPPQPYPPFNPGPPQPNPPVNPYPPQPNPPVNPYPPQPNPPVNPYPPQPNPPVNPYPPQPNPPVNPSPPVPSISTQPSFSPMTSTPEFTTSEAVKTTETVPTNESETTSGTVPTNEAVTTSGTVSTNEAVTTSEFIPETEAATTHELGTTREPIEEFTGRSTVVGSTFSESRDNDSPVTPTKPTISRARRSQKYGVHEGIDFDETVGGIPGYFRQKHSYPGARRHILASF